MNFVQSLRNILRQKKSSYDIPLSSGIFSRPSGSLAGLHDEDTFVIMSGEGRYAFIKRGFLHYVGRGGGCAITEDDLSTIMKEMNEIYGKQQQSYLLTSRRG